MREVKLYSRKWCGWCVEAKDYLQAHGIPFVEIDVGRDPTAERQSHEMNTVEIQPIEEFEIEIRKVGDGFEPGRGLRAAEARRLRHNHVEFLR